MNIGELIQNEYVLRKSRNTNYSVRAFSRDLGLSPATVSLLIRGKMRLSVSRATQVAKALQFKDEEVQYFVDLARCSSKSSEERLQAESRLSQYDTRFNTMSVESFRHIADWASLPAIELIRMYGKKADPKFVANRLKISISHSRKLIQRLNTLGFVKNGHVQTKFLILPDGPADAASQNFHRKILQKAIRALKEDAVESRHFSCGVVRIRKQDLAWAAKEMRQFRRKLAVRLEMGEDHDAVFAISTQFFRLDSDRPDEGK